MTAEKILPGGFKFALDWFQDMTPYLSIELKDDEEFNKLKAQILSDAEKAKWYDRLKEHCRKQDEELHKKKTEITFLRKHYSECKEKVWRLDEYIGGVKMNTYNIDKTLLEILERIRDGKK